MNYWIIISVLLAMAAVFVTVVYRQQRRQLLQMKERESDVGTFEREVDRLRADNLRRRREAASMQRALEQEQDRSDAFEDALRQCEDRLRDAENRLDAAERRRIQAEKEASAGQMRAGLLEKQLKQALAEQSAQEQLYQDILKEREETIAKLQEQQRPRSRKKAAVLDQQVTLNDILKGM